MLQRASQRDGRLAGLIGGVGLSATMEQGLKAIANGLQNAQMLLMALEKWRSAPNKPLDVICLIHLLYQNLGAAIESIPYEFRNITFATELAPILGTSTTGNTKSWITRSACAHIRSFHQLCSAHNPILEQQFSEEATSAQACFRMVLNNFGKTNHVLSQQIMQQILTQVNTNELATLLQSSNFKLATPGYIHESTALILFKNCAEVLNIAKSALAAQRDFSASMPAQAMAALTMQFVGENARVLLELQRAGSLDAATAATFPMDRLHRLRRTRTNMAHSTTVFEQGFGTLEINYDLQMLQREHEVFSRLVAALTKSSKGKEGKEDEVMLPSPVTPPATIITTTTASISPASTSANLEPSKTAIKKQRKKERETQLREQLSAKLNSLGRYPFVIKDLANYDTWDEQTMLELVAVLLSDVSLMTGDKKHPHEQEADIRVCKFIFDNLALYSQKSVVAFLSTPLRYVLMPSSDKDGSYMYMYQGQLINRFIEHGETPIPQHTYVSLLAHALEKDNTHGAAFLLEYGVSISDTIVHLPTMSLGAMEYCVVAKKDWAVQLLIKHGASTRKIGNEPLVAFAYRHGLTLETLKIIIDNTSEAISLDYTMRRAKELRSTTANQSKKYDLKNLKASDGYDIATDFIDFMNQSDSLESAIIGHLSGLDRFYSNEGDTLYFLVLLTRKMLRQEGWHATSEIFSKTKVVVKKTREFTETLPGVSLSVNLCLKGLDRVASVFENISAILRKKDRFPLHYAILEDSVGQYLSSNSLSIQALKAAPKLNLPANMEKVMPAYNPRQFAEAIGAKIAADTLGDFVLKRETSLRTISTAVELPPSFPWLSEVCLRLRNFIYPFTSDYHGVLGNIISNVLEYVYFNPCYNPLIIIRSNGQDPCISFMQLPKSENPTEFYNKRKEELVRQGNNATSDSVDNPRRMLVTGQSFRSL